MFALVARTARWLQGLQSDHGALKRARTQPLESSLGEVERIELLRDCVQPPESPAVVIFVVALDEPLRQTIEQPGTSADRCQLVSHVHSSRWEVKCVSSPLARWRAHVRAPEATALREPRPNSP